MSLWLKNLIRRLMAMTPFEVRRSLPVVTLEPLDLVLANYEARGQMITIVQVGACDGSTYDPIYRHVANGSAHAILIEPNPLAFDRLKRNYEGLHNVTLLPIAIGSQDGEAHLYRVKKSDKIDPEADFTLGFTSFYREHVEHHVEKSDEIERITVPCRSLASLVAELRLTKIDLLQIDAEGFDAAVVRMALDMPSRPSCINFEHRHLKPADRQPLFDRLKAENYLLAYGDWDLLALQIPLLEEMKRGSNVATSMSDAGLSVSR
jgi:FkbM family methyltransferase